VEVAVVISLVLLLSLVGAGGYGAFKNYQDGIAAGAALKTVRQAQLDYLSDHPTLTYNQLPGQADFLTYLPDGQLPVLPAYQGAAATIDYSQYPPVAMANGTVVSTQTNGIWNSGP
jgi:type II secretory pathway pseudopilin PulG